MLIQDKKLLKTGLLIILCLLVSGAFGFSYGKYDIGYAQWVVIFSYSVVVLLVLMTVKYTERSFLLYFFIFAFGVLYVIKIPLMAINGFDSHYYSLTLKTVVSEDDFELAVLYLIPVIFSILFFVALAFPILNSNKTGKVPFIDSGIIRVSFVLIAVYVVFSSVIMLIFGVARMGTEGVSLPYGMSGVLFYSRTTIIPLYLMYVFTAALQYKNMELLKKSLFLLFFLAVSEIVVRASKSPMFILFLQVGVVFQIVSGSFDVYKPKKRHVVIVLCLALFLWPVIEIYRIYVTGINEVVALTDLKDYNDKGLILYSLDRLFQRLLGFSQFAGVISLNANSVFGLHELFVEGKSISTFYTQEVLNITIEGHRSSPSLLGSFFLILGGELMFIGVLLYLLVMTIFWEASYFFSYLSLPVKTVLIFELLNTLMAGTIDSSINRILFTFFVALFLNALLSFMSRLKFGVGAPLRDS